VRCFVSFYRWILTCVPSSDKYDEHRRQWGGGLRGNKSTQMLRKRAKASGQTISAATIGKL
jgi:large subunit ribosomal protein L7Ae